MQIRSVGIDLGKTTFHLVALGDNGKVLLKKKFTQKQLIAFTANMQTCLIGMEACSGSHFLGRALREQGYDVKLIPAQFVKPFVKSNKNDFIDAEAIAERGFHRSRRFPVPPQGPHATTGPAAERYCPLPPQRRQLVRFAIIARCRPFLERSERPVLIAAASGPGGPRRTCAGPSAR